MVGVALGWRPEPSLQGAAAIVLLLLLGTWSLSALGLLLAGTVRAEATLAAANLLFLLLLVGGGLFTADGSRPGPTARLLDALPTAALADGLRAAWAGAPVDGAVWLALLAWGSVGSLLVSRTFRWE